MELSKEVMTVLHRAVLYAKENGYEYVTPETILLILAEEGLFIEAFSGCGGDVKLLSKMLREYIAEYVEKVQGKDPELSAGVNKMLMFAGQSAYNSGSGEVYVRHLVHALWNLEDSYALYYMEQQGITEADMLEELSFLEGDAASTNEQISLEGDKETEGRGFKLYAPCLNDTLKDVNPLIGREDELERTIQILCRKDKNNPLHIGEPGVGKTAITYGLVMRLKEDKVTDAIKGARVFALDLGGMLAGTQYRGDFEKRFKKVLSEIAIIKLMRPETQTDYISLKQRVSDLEKKVAEGIKVTAVTALPSSDPMAQKKKRPPVPDALPEDVKSVFSNWGKILRNIPFSHSALKSALRNSDLTVKGDVLVIAFEDMFENMLNGEDNRQVFEGAVENVVGKHLKYEVIEKQKVVDFESTYPDFTGLINMDGIDVGEMED